MISIHDERIKCFNFPAGEMHIQLDDDFVKNPGWPVSLVWQWKGNDDIIRFLLIIDAFKRLGVMINEIHIPYIPFSPQDRVNHPGEPLSIAVFANIVNSANARKVFVTDPHSDVTTALINNCVVIHQHTIFSRIIDQKFNDRQYILVSPDGGALKKIYKLADACENKPLAILECSKKRDTTNGNITGIHIHGWDDGYRNTPMVLVDDIVWGGKTAAEIGNKLRSFYIGYHHLVLMASHGFFTRGLDALSVFDEIYTRKGKVK